ncbi:hypothetical protein BJ138DRAFT_1116704 [Hygrophoropsis aurantiaca]|uniref:Uncharacterized protein n=1 Tax=Hygrophoropsis aurantiaca TaxID=72124 RepID=A0ACB8A423_9AGAM|nr:hypothetical protein BJ138DRAFT_1116704 [Hygrophoropsis aurantiaca]
MLVFVIPSLLTTLVAFAVDSRVIASNVDIINPSVIPAQCQSTCNSVINTLNTCTIDVCCTNETGSQAEACIDCIVALEPTIGIISWGQAELTALYNDCAEAGVGIAPLTVSYSGATATSGADSTPSLSFPAASTTSSPTTGGKGGNPFGTGDAVALAASSVMVLTVAFIIGGMLVL